MKKNILVFVIAVIASLSISESAFASTDSGVTLTAKVLEVEDYTIYNEELGQDIYGQKVKIKVLTDNNYKDREYRIDNIFDSDYYRQARQLRKGEKINVVLYFSEEGYVNYFYIFNRFLYPHAIWLSILFFVLLIIIGRRKGLKSAVSLALTLSLIVFFMIPLLKNGYSPVPVTIITCLVVTLVTLLIVGGWSSKSAAAILGTLSGLCVAWALSALVAYLGNMTSITSEEVEMLIFNEAGVQFNLKGILLSGIIIGCLGAIMDVAMSISSTIHEVKSANNDLTSRELFKSGMSVGCDIIGTMSNTLVLAYTGSALTLILVQSIYRVSIGDMLNQDFIFEEVLRTLAGSIGMILTVPFTAFIASHIKKEKLQ